MNLVLFDTLSKIGGASETGSVSSYRISSTEVGIIFRLSAHLLTLALGRNQPLSRPLSMSLILPPDLRRTPRSPPCSKPHCQIVAYSLDENSLTNLTLATSQESSAMLITLRESWVLRKGMFCPFIQNGYGDVGFRTYRAL